MGKKSELSAEQRVQLVLRLLSKEEPAAQIARRAGIAEQTLYRWRDEFINAGKRALNGGGIEATQAKAIARLSAQLAERYPWWGYKRIAVVARRNGLAVSNKQVYRVFKAAGLLQKKRVREAGLYQAAR